MLGDVGDTYVYPLLRADSDDELDVRSVLPPTCSAYALHVLDELSDGWIGVTDVARRRGVGVVFDHHVHRMVWQWMVYGGFRGWYHAIVEPWIAGPRAAVTTLLVRSDMMREMRARRPIRQGVSSPPDENDLTHHGRRSQ